MTKQKENFTDSTAISSNGVLTAVTFGGVFARRVNENIKIILSVMDSEWKSPAQISLLLITNGTPMINLGAMMNYLHKKTKLFERTNIKQLSNFQKINHYEWKHRKHGDYYMGNCRWAFRLSADGCSAKSNCS